MLTLSAMHGSQRSILPNFVRVHTEMYWSQNAHRPHVNMLVKNARYSSDQMVMIANQTRLAASMANRMKMGNIVNV